ncbi:MAG: PilZ domain-containing protein [Spirochaetes bacterium]|nr:PilZ domain-containing protein [Spirochaetota bacterium]
MKKKYIQYQKLSDEIKREIRHYHESLHPGTEGASFDESLVEWFNQKFDEWLITRFMPPGQASRRKHFRLDVEVPIRIIDTLIESASNDHDAMEFVGRIVNISRGGLYFKYRAPIEISSIIKVVIDLEGVENSRNSLEALAMVVRSDRLEENEYGIGIMFSSIYGENRELLDLFILKNLSYYIYQEAES